MKHKYTLECVWQGVFPESLELILKLGTMLFWIHNPLSNKELYENIFFEGFAIEGYEEDGTPVISLKVGT